MGSPGNPCCCLRDNNIAYYCRTAIISTVCALPESPWGVAGRARGGKSLKAEFRSKSLRNCVCYTWRLGLPLAREALVTELMMLTCRVLGHLKGWFFAATCNPSRQNIQQAEHQFIIRLFCLRPMFVVFAAAVCVVLLLLLFLLLFLVFSQWVIREPS